MTITNWNDPLIEDAIASADELLVAVDQLADVAIGGPIDDYVALNESLAEIKVFTAIVASSLLAMLDVAEMEEENSTETQFRGLERGDFGFSLN